MMRLIPLLALSLMVAGPASAAKLYRWVDDNGKVFYSDKVPPSAAEHERKTLDKHGMVVESAGRAKTAEEAAREAELKKRREAQQRLAEEQKKRDELLITTFQHEDDIIMTRDGKIKAVDAQIKILRTSLRYSQERLARLKAKAGAKPRGKQKREIDKLEKQVKRYYRDILDLEKQKQGIRTTYAQNLARYRQLKTPQHSAKQEVKKETKETSSVQLENLLVCQQDCSALWRKVNQFVRDKASTGIDVAGDSIIMSKPPARDSEIGLSVSRNKQDGGTEELFLDLQCKDTVAGQQHCQSPAAKEILKAFRALR